MSAEDRHKLSHRGRSVPPRLKVREFGPILAPSRSFTGGLTQGVATDRMLWSRVWLLSVLGFKMAITLFLACIMVKKSCLLPLFWVQLFKNHEKETPADSVFAGLPSRVYSVSSLSFLLYPCIFCLAFRIHTPPTLEHSNPSSLDPDKLSLYSKTRISPKLQPPSPESHWANSRPIFEPRNFQENEITPVGSD